MITLVRVSVPLIPTYLFYSEGLSPIRCLSGDDHSKASAAYVYKHPLSRMKRRRTL